MREVSALSRQVIERGPLSGLGLQHVQKPLASMVICGQRPNPDCEVGDSGGYTGFPSSRSDRSFCPFGSSPSYTPLPRFSRVHPQPGRRQPRPAGPVEPSPQGRGHRHRDREWYLRYPRCHGADIAHDGMAIVPIRKNGRAWKEDCPAAKGRDEILRATRHYGRAFWKRWTGYHAGSSVEAKMRCQKAFGERIAARDPDCQTAEIHIRVDLINCFNAIGTPRSSAWPEPERERGTHASGHLFAKTPSALGNQGFSNERCHRAATCIRLQTVDR